MVIYSQDTNSAVTQFSPFLSEGERVVAASSSDGFSENELGEEDVLTG